MLRILMRSSVCSDAWNIMRNKFATKILNDNSRFVMVFGGSSITAGHDNYFNESYPIVFERRMKNAFNHLGVDLQIRNIALGQNQCIPYDLCYFTLGGEDVDWMSWEQSFNCGRQPGIPELMARMAGFKNAVLFFFTSGGVTTKECLPSSDPVPWTSERWTPDIGGVKSVYTPDRAAVYKFKSKMQMWFAEANSVGRFATPLLLTKYQV